MSCNLFAAAKKQGIAPKAATVPKEPIQEISHVVRKGETLSSIAGKYNDVTYQEIAQANNIADPNNIYVGQRLNISNQPPQPKAPKTPKPTPQIKQPSDETSTCRPDKDGCCKSIKLQCTRSGRRKNKKTGETYSLNYGPVYWGVQSLSSYSGWSELINTQQVTNAEKTILVGMSINEGKLDSINAYDSEVLTMGAMQKTINKQGTGQLAKQFQDYKNLYPNKFKTILERCGWSVENNTVYYKNPHQKNSQKITGTSLKALLRKGYNKNNVFEKVENKHLKPIYTLAKDSDYQKLQVLDFIKYYREIMNKKIHGYKISEYIHSNLGRATVLDQYVNRPAYTVSDLKTAIDKFTNELKLSTNPIKWGKQHAAYEKKIIDYYGKHRRGTDMKNRYNKLKGQF